jgi:hypothetical protein
VRLSGVKWIRREADHSLHPVLRLSMSLPGLHRNKLYIELYEVDELSLWKMFLFELRVYYTLLSSIFSKFWAVKLSIAKSIPLTLGLKAQNKNLFRIFVKPGWKTFSINGPH